MKPTPSDRPHPRDNEWLTQCWHCSHVETRTLSIGQASDLRCTRCGRCVELLTCNGSPFR